LYGGCGLGLTSDAAGVGVATAVGASVCAMRISPPRLSDGF
jgi:hypothetical protein